MLVKKAITSEIVKIPESIEVEVDGRRISVKGPLGKVNRDFSHTSVNIRKEDGEVVVEAIWPDKKTAAMVGTVRSLIKNMVTGVAKGFRYKLKIAFAHFPISVKVQDKEVLVENFGGERRARKAKVQGDVKVAVDNDEIVVEGVDLQDVSQTAANIEQATKIKKRDPRVFLDGIYVYEKKEGV